jgi:hypothetical protein
MVDINYDDWSVLVHEETKWISIQKTYKMGEVDPNEPWKLIADDFSEEDANRYAKMNYKDRMMATYPVAIDARKRGHTPYVEMSDEEFEALFHRMTKEEYFDALPGLLKREQEEEEAKKKERADEFALRERDSTGLRILYLYGYGNNKILAETKQLKGMKTIFPGATIDVLEGPIELTGPGGIGRRFMANIEDNNPDLLYMARQDSSMVLRCYCPIEQPPEDPKDRTIQYCKAQKKLPYAKASKKEMDKAVDWVAEQIVSAGGYDMIAGFSCGGEVVSVLIGKLAEINRKVRTPTRFVTLFGVRNLYFKYGSPLKGELPSDLKVILVHGSRDDEDLLPKTLKDEDNEGNIFYDLDLFKEQFDEVGVPYLECVFDGGHMLPEYVHAFNEDHVYVPMKKFVNFNAPAAAA